MRCPIGRACAAVVVLFAAATTPAQSYILTTTFAGGNGQTGNMFDLQATGSVPLRIMSFDINTTGTGLTVQVHTVTAGTTYVGNEANPAAWTLLATTTVTGLGAGVPTPLNLNLNHLIPAGIKVGFYVTLVSGTLTYTNGTAAGAAYANDSYLTFYEGIGIAYPFGTTFNPRIFNGRIHYQLGQNIFSISQSGPFVGDLNIALQNIPSSAYEGWMVVTTVTSQPVGTGPILGIWPDAFSWEILGYPYFPGNPFHFHAGDIGFYPVVPFTVGPGGVNYLAGQTMDAVCVFLSTIGTYDSRSNVVRITFQ